MAAGNLTYAQKGLLGVSGLCVSVFYAYWRKSRAILPDSLIPDEDREEVIPPQELSSWFYGKYEEEFAKAYMTDVYSYLIAKSFKILKINSPESKLKILDCGCGTGGLSFQLLQKQSNKIDEIYGVDLSPESIKIANEKLKSCENTNKSKLQFKCKDATVLTEFADNYFDIGYCSLVLHDMPHRVPMNILCELSRVCKYVIVLDWTSPMPWNKAGIRNRRIEFMVGPTHFAGFRHFVALGGMKAHIQALMKYRSGIDIVFSKKIDGETQELYVLNTTNAKRKSKL